MRHVTATLCLCLALAAAPHAAQAAQAEGQPTAAAVREYIDLFGYREMLELSARQQLDTVLEAVRQTSPELQPGVLDGLRRDLEAILHEESARGAEEMIPVFQRRLGREDVAYLISVGRDPRMRRVVALQPVIARDLEGVGEDLAEAVTRRAAEHIRERLRQLDRGRAL